jgi:hypothetical protein
MVARFVGDSVVIPTEDATCRRIVGNNRPDRSSKEIA